MSGQLPDALVSSKLTWALGSPFFFVAGESKFPLAPSAPPSPTTIQDQDGPNGLTFTSTSYNQPQLSSLFFFFCSSPKPSPTSSVPRQVSASKSLEPSYLRRQLARRRQEKRSSSTLFRNHDIHKPWTAHLQAFVSRARAPIALAFSTSTNCILSGNHLPTFLIRLCTAAAPSAARHSSIGVSFFLCPSSIVSFCTSQLSGRSATKLGLLSQNHSNAKRNILHTEPTSSLFYNCSDRYVLRALHYTCHCCSTPKHQTISKVCRDPGKGSALQTKRGCTSFL